MSSELEQAAARLLDGLDGRLARWLVRRGAEVLQAWRPGVVDDDWRIALEAAAGRSARAVADELSRLLGRPAAQQWTSPLDVVRRSVGPVTDVLRRAGVPPVVRDEDDERRLPDDTYGLAPANWGDVDPGLVDPALMWGAAKARAHLADRTGAAAAAAAPPPAAPPPGSPPLAGAPPAAGSDASVPVDVIAYAPDLMDQSRLRAAGVRTFARTPADLADRPVELALVDVSRPGLLEVVGRVPGRVIGFCPHVDDELAQAARAAGCDEVLARSVFFRRVASLIAAGGGTGTRLSP